MSIRIPRIDFRYLFWAILTCILIAGLSAVINLRIFPPRPVPSDTTVLNNNTNGVTIPFATTYLGPLH